MTAAVVDLDAEPEGYKPDGKAAPRWQPDLQLVPAMLGTPRWPRMLTDYDEGDRCWIVAGLSLAGWSAEEIVQRIGGSIRLIRDIRSKPMTEACKLWQLEVGQVEKDLRVERIDRAATEHKLAQAIRDVKRLRKQLDQLLDAHTIGQVESFPCGHAKVPFNVYRHQGREHCRDCGRDRSARYRAKLSSCKITQSA